VSVRLRVDGLWKAFGDETVLRGVSLAAGPGEVVTVTGDPATGRTTLVRCLTGGYRPDAGAVTVDDGTTEVDLTTADARTLAWLRRHHIAVLDGPLAAPPRQVCAEVVARSAGIDRSAAVAALERLGAGAAASVPIGRLRPAAQRTVALAAALAGDRPLVVLDEPAAEPAVHAWIDELASAGRTVVVVDAPGGGAAAMVPSSVRHRVGHLEQGVVAWQEP
jgi:ABC-type sugar transport system ATPase subunit